jgi:hypothetical protein
MRYILLLVTALAGTTLMGVPAEASPVPLAALKSHSLKNQAVQTVGYARRRARRCYLYGYCPPVYGVYPPPPVYAPAPTYAPPPPPPAYVYPAPVYTYPYYGPYPRRYW